jgi:hypothetical protein
MSIQSDIRAVVLVVSSDDSSLSGDQVESNHVRVRVRTSRAAQLQRTFAPRPMRPSIDETNPNVVSIPFAA